MTQESVWIARIRRQSLFPINRQKRAKRGRLEVPVDVSTVIPVPGRAGAARDSVLDKLARWCENAQRDNTDGGFLFRRKGRAPDTTPPVEIETEPEPPAPRLSLSRNLKRAVESGEVDLRVTDVDFSDPDNLRLEHDGEWKPLERYKTRVWIALKDLTVAGGWHRRPWEQKDPGEWTERVEAVAELYTGGSIRRAPVLTFLDDNRHRAEDAPNYTVHEMSFSETALCVDRDFEAHLAMAAEDRPSEERYLGSPIRLFRDGKDAHAFIMAELLSYSEMNRAADPSLLEPSTPQRYRWPEVQFSDREYRSWSDDRHEGFYGSVISVPKSVYDGLRRGIADFRDSAEVSIVAEMELYGIDPPAYDPLEPLAAKVSVAPFDAQLTGKILDVRLDWREDARPFNGLLHMWD